MEGNASIPIVSAQSIEVRSRTLGNFLGVGPGSNHPEAQREGRPSVVVGREDMAVILVIDRGMRVFRLAE